MIFLILWIKVVGAIVFYSESRKFNNENSKVRPETGNKSEIKNSSSKFNASNDSRIKQQEEDFWGKLRILYKFRKKNGIYFKNNDEFLNL